MGDWAKADKNSFVPGLAEQLDHVVQRGGTLWQELHDRPVLLTGGTGFIGRWLLESLVSAQKRLGFNLHVVVVTRNVEAFRTRAPHLLASPCLRFHQGDIRSTALPRSDFAYVIHAAATSAKEAFDGASPLTKFDSAVDGTRRVLELAAAGGKPRVLIVGSGSVYGTLSPANGPVSEDDRCAPSTFDTAAGPGHGRRTAEFLSACYAEQYGFSLTVARCFAFVGAFMPLDLQYAIGNFIQNALHEDEIIVRSDGSPVRTYMFAGDLVVWLLTLLLRGQARRVYNVGSDRPVALGELAHLVGSLVAPAKRVRIVGQAGSGAGSFYVPDINLARRELGLEVWTTLEDAILQTAHAARFTPWSSH